MIKQTLRDGARKGQVGKHKIMVATRNMFTTAMSKMQESQLLVEILGT